MAPRQFRPGRLDMQDLEEAVSGLTGLYASHDLYVCYCGRAAANGREPETEKVFYDALTYRGYVRETVRAVACRVVASDGELFPGEITPVKRPAPRLRR